MSEAKPSTKRAGAPSSGAPAAGPRSPKRSPKTGGTRSKKAAQEDSSDATAAAPELPALGVPKAHSARRAARSTAPEAGDHLPRPRKRGLRAQAPDDAPDEERAARDPAPARHADPARATARRQGARGEVSNLTAQLKLPRTEVSELGAEGARQEAANPPERAAPTPPRVPSEESLELGRRALTVHPLPEIRAAHERAAGGRGPTKFSSYARLVRRPAEATLELLRATWKELELPLHFEACSPDELISVAQDLCLSRPLKPLLLGGMTATRLEVAGAQSVRRVWAYRVRGHELKCCHLDLEGCPPKTRLSRLRSALGELRAGDQVMLWAWHQRHQSPHLQPWPELIGVRIASPLDLSMGLAPEKPARKKAGGRPPS